MLGKCEEHGFYRGEKCTVCNKAGKFLMNEQEMNTLGRLMAGILRHFPNKFELYIDPQGWVNLDDMVDAVKENRRRFHWLRKHPFTALKETDDKGRFQVDNNMIRATYGHTVDVDPDLPSDDIPERLYYPAAQAELSLLLDEGLTPSDKMKVHLSRSFKDAVVAGEHRYDDAVILEVDALRALENGCDIGQAGTTVFTTFEIPGEFLKVADMVNESDETDNEAADEGSSVSVEDEVDKEEEMKEPIDEPEEEGEELADRNDAPDVSEDAEDEDEEIWDL